MCPWSSIWMALVNSDTLLENMLALIRHRPSSILLFPIWFLRGKAVAKAKVAKGFSLDAATLGYRPDLLEFLQNEQAKGRRLVLATAAHESIASSTSEHLKIFEEVFASTDSVNLKGQRKRDTLVARYGLKGFDYIGDSKADTSVWAACRTGHIAGSMRSLPDMALQAGAKQGKVFASRRPGFKTWMRAMRPHQWVKNLLVFAPTLLNHHLNWDVLKSLLVTFAAFVWFRPPLISIMICSICR